MEATSLQRVRRGEAQWREVFERFDQSQMKVGPFCEAERISVASFHKWRRRLLEPPPVGFIELPSERIRRDQVRAELDLGRGVVVRIFG